MDFMQSSELNFCCGADKTRSQGYQNKFHYLFSISIDPLLRSFLEMTQLSTSRSELSKHHKILFSFL